MGFIYNKRLEDFSKTAPDPDCLKTIFNLYENFI
jgi:hypothetical protein